MASGRAVAIRPEAGGLGRRGAAAGPDRHSCKQLRSDCAGLRAKPVSAGGNVTGIVSRQLELVAKQIDLLIEAFPERKRLGALWDALSADQFAAAEREAKARQLTLRAIKLENPPSISTSAFRTLAQDGVDMLRRLGQSAVLGAARAYGRTWDPVSFAEHPYPAALRGWRRADVLRRRFCPDDAPRGVLRRQNLRGASPPSCRSSRSINSSSSST